MPQHTVHPLWGSLALERESTTSLQEQIVAFFRTAIGDGRLPAGLRVNSSRQLAAHFDVSRTTAVEAYARLVEEGWFVTRPGAGVFVADVPPDRYRLRSTAGEVPDDAVRHEVWARDGRQYHLPLAPGMPAIDRFPWPVWTRLINQVCRERKLEVVGYGDPQGEPVLRQAIVDYLASARGIRCSVSQVVVLSGTEQMLQFIVSELTAPGSLVWTEDPGATYLRRTLVDAGFALCAIPLDERGISVAEGMRIAPAARVAVVAPSHQYPTGISMGLERRRELVAWAESTAGWIVENEIDGDYRYAPRPLPSLYGLSAAHRVVYCGSLSKALAPGLRINYLVLPATLVGTLRWRATLAPMLTQHVLARFSTAGHMTAHMNRMRNLYARRRAALLHALGEQAADLLDVPAVPETGLRIRATLLCAADDRRVAQRCLQQGIKVDALSVCYVNRPPIRGLIIGFASTPEEHVADAVAKLVRVIREEAGQ